MKRLLKILALFAAAGFIAIQFIRPDFTNPPIVPGQPIESTTVVPAEVQMLLSNSCSDCHSNKTIHPWYAQIAPSSWFLAGHISDGRKELNFSEWNTYSVDRKVRKLDEICEMVGSGQMPLPSYLWLHRDAELEHTQRQLLCDWATAEGRRLSGT